jgi:hypothetical protein
MRLPVGHALYDRLEDLVSALDVAVVARKLAEALGVNPAELVE